MKRRFCNIATIVGILFCLAIPLILVACDDTSQDPRSDLPDEKVRIIEPNDAQVYLSPDEFPNLVTYCVRTARGHRVFITTRIDQDPVYIEDRTCAR